MRFNRKAAQRAIKLASAHRDARVVPFGLAFQYEDSNGTLRVGVRQRADTYFHLRYGYQAYPNQDDKYSVRFSLAADWPSMRGFGYKAADELRPALKPRSLKKHELRKQARDLRRMKQYD